MSAEPCLVVFDVDGTLVDAQVSIINGFVSGFEAAGFHTKQPRAERRIRVAPGANLSRQRPYVNSRINEPGVVVALESLAIGVAQQAGAVGNLRWNFGWRPDGLVLGD